MLKIDEKHYQDIINFGAFAYSASQISDILRVPLDQVQKEMNNPKTKFGELYQHGRATAKYVLDKKLFEQAKGGDLKALEEIEYRNPAMKK